MRPLDRLPTIRAKLGSTIVFAVGMTLIIVFLLLGYALRNSPRDSEVLSLLATARRAAQGKLGDLPADTQVIGQPVEGVSTSTGPDLGVDPPPFDDQQAHWGITQGVEYVVVPRVADGQYQGTIAVLKTAPGQGFGARLRATFGFLGSVWWQFLIAGVIAGGIALVVARILARGMTKPLRDMAQAAKSMSTGDYSKRVRTRSRDEVGQLATAFNKMSSELEDVERLRRELVANVSHELKTPITALRAHLENVLDGVEDPNPETLQVMLQQSERLSRLVEQLLELSRLESGDLPLTPEDVPLDDLVSQVVSEVEVAGAGSDVQIDNDVSAELPPVRADRERVHQVLFNLLDNAVRFTPPGGHVTVSAARTNGRCTVTVADTGPGIEAEHLPRLFERFYRADSARARNDGGTGIGLAIARSVVEAHGGHIWAESEPGEGSAFRFDLPVADRREQ